MIEKILLKKLTKQGLPFPTDSDGKCKSLKDKIIPQSKVNTYLHYSFTNVAFGGKF